MSIKFLLFFVLPLTFATVQFQGRSPTNSYKLVTRSQKAAAELLDLTEGLRERCSKATKNNVLYCESLTKDQLYKLVQEDSRLYRIDEIKDIRANTIKASSSGRSKRSVPWNLDRLNQFLPGLDGSYRDEAEVDVYILGSGIRVDHSEFGNRARVGFSALPDEADCAGSGTALASLVGGSSAGIARRANLIAVKVMDCNDLTDEAKILAGIEYIQDAIIKSGNRSAVVLVGFTIDKNSAVNDKIVSLTETRSGILVVGGAGENDNLDACQTTPASAQGPTALNGVVTVGATDENDAVISNIGECADLFAPGKDVPSAGIGDPIAMTTCTGSLCAAALATGVIAHALRDNSKIDIEVQKSMLVNGATLTPLSLPSSNSFDVTQLVAQTPQKILYYTCGYERDTVPPVCESYTAVCNNSHITTFDQIDVPLFQQRHEKCNFVVFKSDNVQILGSYHGCSLGAYSISWHGASIQLLPGPRVFINGELSSRDEIGYTSDLVVVEHLVDAFQSPLEPVVRVTLLTNGEQEIKIEFDCVSRLRIELTKMSNYHGNTAGLCGFYDDIGTNDYRLPDGSSLQSYSTQYHDQWRHTNTDECKSCGDDCDSSCDDTQCQRDAQTFCSSKFAEASSQCLTGVNVYKETQKCIEEVTKCCCQAKETDNTSPDLNKECCQNSFFGNFERNREGCDICTDAWCVKEETHEHCTDSSQGKTKYDYNEKINYYPEDCCYFIPGDDDQICVAPRNKDMMWEHKVPVCQEKTCVRPSVPNDQTIIQPDKAEYGCGETVTVTCKHCFEIDNEPQIIKCEAGTDVDGNDAQWNEDVHACSIITCPEPELPYVRKDKGLTYPLSYIIDQNPDPRNNECGDTVTFACDICYDLIGDKDALCEDSHSWTDSPRCNLRECTNAATNPPLDYPLTIRNNLNTCNDTIEYLCKTHADDVDSECYALIGEKYSQCVPDDDNSIGWNTDRPSCQIKTCRNLDANDFEGEGHYQFISSAASEYEKIYLTGSEIANNPHYTSCGSVVEATCDECSYLCGRETSRICLPDGSWNGTRLTCIVRACEPPSNNPDNNADYTPKKEAYDCKEDVTFRCIDDCHEYEGGQERHQCVPDIPVPFNPHDPASKWSGDEYSCKIKHCPAVTAPENGYITSGEGLTTCGSLIEFACDPCYELDGEKEVKCQSNKTWTHDIPTCVKKECPALYDPFHGSVKVDPRPRCGDPAEYSCDRCYELIGADTSECQDDKSWSNPAPTCKEYQCPPRDDPLHGVVDNKWKYFCDEEVTYKCDTCYEMKGAGSAVCNPPGVWSEDPPTCHLMKCLPPIVPPNTRITPVKEIYDCGDTIEVECENCHELGGPIDIHCEHGGVWSDLVPECSTKECEDPEPLKLSHDCGKPDTNDTVAMFKIVKADEMSRVCGGSGFEYECNECYNLKGNKKVLCQDSKRWTEPPICQLKTCDEPEVLTEHLVMSPERKSCYYCKEQITYSCDDECWELEGERQRTCAPSEGSNVTQWSTPPPVCKILKCMPPPEDTLDPLLTVEGLYTCGATITFSCPPCFRLVGSKTATCTAEEEWDAAPPTCEPVCCPALPVIMSGDPTYTVPIMTYNHTKAGDEEQMQFCNGDHVCQQVEAPCHECYEYYDSWTQQNYDAAPTRECRHPHDGEGPGEWTNADELCTRKQCEARPVDLVTQHIRYTDSMMEQRVLCGNRVEFECDPCHESLNETMVHECLPNKRWNHDVPKCYLKECGDLPTVAHCPFEEGNMTCGWHRKLDCEDCWYTDKCMDHNEEDITVTCTTSKEWEWNVEKPVVHLKTCDAPPDIDHATFVSQGAGYGCSREVRYECDECYKFEKNRECDCATVKCTGSHPTDCTKGSWTGDFPTCVAKTCEALPVPEHAHPVKQSTGCKKVTQFECDTGYELVAGDLTRTCTTNEEWTGAAPVCRVRNCTALEAPSHGSLKPDDRQHYETVVQFSCDDCYEFPSSMTDPNILTKITNYPRYHILKCEEYGNWNGSEPVCRKKRCNNPGVPRNGEIDSWNFGCGETVTFTCNTGYYHLKGDAVQTCGTDSKWDGKPFECERMSCVKPEKPADGDFRPVMSEYTYQSLVEFYCDDCFELEEGANSRILCNNTENPGGDQGELAGWSSKEPPTCQRITCPALKKPGHGTLVPHKRDLPDNACGQKIQLKCPEGFEVSGRPNITCRSSGAWTDEQPECLRTCCKTVDHITSGEVEQLDDSQCYGDKIEYSCDECYELEFQDPSDKAIQMCNADSMWSGSKPRCRQKRCPHLEHPKNGRVVSTGNTCKSTGTFTCDPGFILEGVDEVTCREEGTWSSNPPVCRELQCPGDVLHIANGMYYPRRDDGDGGTLEPPIEGATVETPATSSAPILPSLNYPHDTRVDFECDEGYELIGEETIDCVQGTWSTDVPTCEVEKCGEFGEVENGSVFVKSRRHGGTASFSCDRCYTLQGEVELTCLNGYWNPMFPPTCVENVCVPPGIEENSYIVGYNHYQTSYSCDDVIEYECDDNYQMYGDPTRTCQENGTWTGKAPSCAYMGCDPLDPLENGVSKKFSHNGTEYVEFWCVEGYMLMGDNITTCVKGQWMGTMPTCSKEVCGDPGTPDWGIKIGGSHEYGDTVSYQCKTGYQLRGQDTIECTAAGVWSDDPPYCVCNECPRLEYIPNGIIESTDDNSYLSTIQYVCDPGYEIYGNPLRTCTASGEWDGVEPSCERVNCTADYGKPQGAYVTFDQGHRYQDTITIACSKTTSWTRTCQDDGTWSGELPARCDCEEVSEWVEYERKVPEPGKCKAGICTPDTITIVTDKKLVTKTVCK